jgi:hypothetical protein
MNEAGERSGLEGILLFYGLLVRKQRLPVHQNARFSELLINPSNLFN